VTRGRLPQRAGLPGLNSGGAATLVSPHITCNIFWYLNAEHDNIIAVQWILLSTPSKGGRAPK